MGRERLSIDVPREDHRRIKACAALHGETIRDYVLESVRERLRRESEDGGMSFLADHIHRDPVLREVWDNERDAAYDKL